MNQPEFITHAEVTPTNLLVFTTSYNRIIPAGPLHSYGGPGITSIRNGLITYANGATSTVQSAGLTVTGERGPGIDLIYNGIIYYTDGGTSSVQDAGIMITGAQGPGITDIYPITGTNNFLVVYGNGETGSMYIPTLVGTSVNSIYNVSGTDEAVIQYSNSTSGTLYLPSITGSTGTSIVSLYNISGTYEAMIQYSDNTSGTITLPSVTGTSINGMYNLSGTFDAIVEYSNNTSSILSLPAITGPTGSSITNVSNGYIIYNDGTSTSLLNSGFPAVVHGTCEPTGGIFPTANIFPSYYTSQTATNANVIYETNNKNIWVYDQQNTQWLGYGMSSLRETMGVPSGSSSNVINVRNKSTTYISNTGTYILPTGKNICITNKKLVCDVPNNPTSLVLMSNNIFNGSTIHEFYPMLGTMYVAGSFQNGMIKCNPEINSCQSFSNTLFNNTVYTMVGTGTTIFAGGDITPGYISSFDTVTETIKSPFGTGCNATVYTLALSGSTLLAGGAFTTVDRATSANRFASYNVLTNTWNNSMSSTGFNGTVYSIAYAGPTAYVGGSFTTVNSRSINNIAMYNGVGFNSLSTGVEGRVNAITNINTDIYVGGSFNGNVRKYDSTSNTWMSLFNTGANANSQIYSLSVSTASTSPTIHIGGSFSSFEGYNTNNYIQYNVGNGWDQTSKIGTGLAQGSLVACMAMTGTNLYCGGRIDSINGSKSNCLAMFNTSTNTWSNPFGSGCSGGLVNPPSVNSLVLLGTNLYIGGTFSVAGGLLMNGFGIFNIYTNVWSSPYGLEPGIMGGTQKVNTIFPYIDTTGTQQLIVAGNFTKVNQSNWISLFQYTPSTNTLSNPFGNVFTESTSTVMALAMYKTTLIVGGSFSNVLGNPWQNLITYDISTQIWNSPFIAQPIGIITSLLVYGSKLYIGGSGLSSINNVACTNLICYDFESNTVTNPFGNINGTIYSLWNIDTYIYVAGQFTSINNNSVYRFARWNTVNSNWDYMFSSNLYPDDSIYTLYSDITNANTVYVGGMFTTIGGVLNSSIAKFDGMSRTLSAIGRGVDGTVRTIAPASQNSIYTNGKGWNGNFGTNINAGTVNSFVQVGRYLYFGGSFTSPAPTLCRYDTLTQTFANIARWDSNIIVTKLISYNSILFIGGLYTSGYPCLLSYDINTQILTSIYTGNNAMSSGIHALLIYNGFLYAGGNFIGECNYLLKYNLTTGEITSIGNPDSTVTSITRYGTTLWFVGNFNNINLQPSIKIASYETQTSTWTYFNDTGIDNNITNSMMIDDQLYIVGKFTSVGSKSSPYIAQFNTTTRTWVYPFGTGLDNWGHAIIRNDNYLYVGGYRMSVANGVPCGRIVRFNLTTGVFENVFGSGLGSITNEVAMGALYISSGNLYCGGDFSTVNSVAQNCIACWDMSTQALPIMDAGIVYIGGSFSRLNNLLDANILGVSPKLTKVNSKFMFNNALYTSCYMWTSATVDCSYNSKNEVWQVANLSGNILFVE